MTEIRDILIVRQTCLKAAAEVAAAHPESEVAYDEEGHAVGAVTVAIGDRVLALAEAFETWALREEGLAEPESEPIAVSAPAQTVQNGHEAAAPAASPPPVRQAAVAAPVAPRSAVGFDPSKCPLHPEKTDKSKYAGLFCKDKGCTWKRQSFVNNEGEPDAYTVTKTKWRGKWYDDAELMQELVAEGVLA